MKWLRLCVGLVILGSLTALLAVGPAPGPVLRNNAEKDIQASALFYMDLEAMPDLEQRLEVMKQEREES